MASKYWIKLYHEILDDPKMGRMSDRLWRRVIEMFLLAGDYDKDGELPPVEDVAWRLRTDNETLQQDIEALQRIGILSVNGSIHIVTNFSERQSAMSGAERISRFRDSRRKEEYYGNEDATDSVTKDVTSRYTDIDIDKEVDTDKKRKDKEETDTLFSDMKTAWGVLFKDKPQPRSLSEKHRRNLNARADDSYFMEHWYEALERASRVKALHSRDEGWFDFWWLIEHDEHVEKLYNGKYDFLDKRNGKPQPPARAIKPVSAKDL